MFRRIHRSVTLALAVMAVLVAAVLPACAIEGCCAKDAETSLHAQMPCCDEVTVAASDEVHVLPAAAPVAAIKLQDAMAFVSVPAPAVHAIAAHAHQQDHDPPLFLLNAQFLI